MPLPTAALHVVPPREVKDNATAVFALEIFDAALRGQCFPILIHPDHPRHGCDRRIFSTHFQNLLCM